MYTYTQTFFGVPLSQIDSVDYEDSFKMILQGLTEQESIDNVLALDIQEYLSDCHADENDRKIFIMFIDWLKENQEALKDLGFKFESDYHGGDEYPRIFGTYDGGISLPDCGCMQIDTNDFSKVIETEKKVKEIFSTIPEELVNRFPPFGQAGFWANDHSS